MFKALKTFVKGQLLTFSRRFDQIMKENLGNLSQTSKEDESEIETKDREKYFRGLGRGSATGEVSDR